MDLWFLLMFLVTFLLCGGIVLGVFVFGWKEKSFEEALEENKKKTLNGSSAGIKKGGGHSNPKKEGKKMMKPLKTGTVTTQNPQQNNNNNNTPKKEEEKDSVERRFEVEEEVQVVMKVPEKFASPEKKGLDLVKPSLQESTKPVPPSTQKKPIKKPKEEKKVVVINKVSEIMSGLKNTVMDEGECQQLIDFLLSKQSSSSSGEWVQNSGQESSTKVLKKQLQEKELEIEEANVRCKSVSDKLAMIRAELNSAKILSNNSQRLIDEMKAKHERDYNNMHSTMQQQIDSRIREISSLQSQLAVQATQTQQLESRISQLSVPARPAVDPAMFGELEQLRAAKEQQDSKLIQLTSLVNSLKESEEQLKNDKVKIGEALEERCKAQAEASNTVCALQERVKELLSEKNDNEMRLSETFRSLEVVHTSGKEKESEIAKLIEENERLAELLASGVERPKAEGQEAGVKQNGDLNGFRTIERIPCEDCTWQKKYLATMQDKETIVNDYERINRELKKEIESSASTASKLKEDLEQERAKNDDVRNKNWKAMEALSLAEQKVVNQTKNEELLKESIAKAKKDIEDCQKEFFGRLLPQVKVSKSDHQVWLGEYETAIKELISLRNAKDEGESSSVQKLEQQIWHYKSILSETEQMLYQLQSYVESEEKCWKQRLQKKDVELEEIRLERDALNRNNSEMAESLSVVKQAEEVAQDYASFIQEQKQISDYMQGKLHQLQKKLSTEEIEKDELRKKLIHLETQLSEKKLLNEEIRELKSDLETEKKTKNELAERMVKMGQVVSTGQEALQHEQKAVQILKDQITNLKTNSKGGNLVESDQVESKSKADYKVGSSTSLGLAEVSSAQLTKKGNKKSAKKKLLDLFK